jgi:PAS domain S-box-containing protein
MTHPSNPFSLEDLVEHLPVAVYRTTPDGTIVAGNPALAELFGARSIEELADVDVRTLYADPEARQHMIARVDEGAAISEDEIELKRLDGIRIWVRISSRGVLDEAGNVRFYEGVVEDVTARRATNAELVRTNTLLDALTLMQNHYIAGVDPGLLFDQLLEDLLETTNSEYGFIAQMLHDEVGSAFLRTYAMSDISWNEATRRMFAENGPRGMEFHNLETLFGRAVTDKAAIVSNDPLHDPRRSGRPDGHPPLDSFLGVPILKGDEVLGMIALANRPGGYDEALVDDMQPLVATVGSMIAAIRTDAARQAAEERERGREQLYRAVVEYATEAVVAFRDDGTIEAVNPAAARMTGYNAAEMVGRNISELLPEDRLEEYLATGERALEEGATAELLALDRYGNEIPVELSFGRTEFGAEPITTAIVRNVSERKAIEAAMRQAKEAAERTSRAKDEFLAGMSHELRTPLNAVIGLSAILGREVHGPINPKQHEYVHQIESSGRHLLELINDILDLAKIEARKMEAEPQRVAIGPLVSSAVAVIHETAVAKGLRLEVSLDEPLPAAFADPLRTKQILINLLSNAVKFTERGGDVGVGVRAAGEHVVITVWDTGIGIPSGRLEDVFAPFEQLDSSLARTHEGTGLGLALSRRFAEIQGGSLEVASKVGSGSQFTLTLPLDVGSQREGQATAIDADPDRTVGGRPRDALRVLLVEDNDLNRLMVADYLEAHGLAVDVAVDGNEGIARARELLPDVILMDVQLPGRDGLSVTRELKDDDATRAIPIIALTALAMKGDAERCLDAGCDGYLSKPCDPADVLTAVLDAAVARVEN